MDTNTKEKLVIISCNLTTSEMKKLKKGWLTVLEDTNYELISIIYDYEHTYLLDRDGETWRFMRLEDYINYKMINIDNIESKEYVIKKM